VPDDAAARLPPGIQQGVRVLGVGDADAGREETARESELDFAGYLLFLDPPKPGVKTVLSSWPAWEWR
jgi:magnesium-transporting ATPase (P-type)